MLTICFCIILGLKQQNFNSKSFIKHKLHDDTASQLKSLLQMLRAISLTRAHLRSPTLTLKPSLFTLVVNSPYSSSPSDHPSNVDVDKGRLVDVATLLNRDPDDPPRLFLVQPRLRPPTFLQAKLNEALCLANSLEEQRDGYFNTDFFDKALPPHVVVQNPALKSAKPRAGMLILA